MVTTAQDWLFNITLVIPSNSMNSPLLSPNIQQRDYLLGRASISMYLRQADHPKSPHRSRNESYTPSITLFISSTTPSPTALAAIYIDARDPTGNWPTVKQKINSIQDLGGYRTSANSKTHIPARQLPLQHHPLSFQNRRNAPLQRTFALASR